MFDVLQYIAFAKPLITRAARVETNKDNIFNLLSKDEREFVNFVIDNYLKIGVEELDISKLSTLLTSKYGSIHSAQEILGDTTYIKNMFINFQKTLYMEKLV